MGWGGGSAHRFLIGYKVIGKMFKFFYNIYTTDFVSLSILHPQMQPLSPSGIPALGEETRR